MFGNHSRQRTASSNVRQLWSWIGGVVVIIAICLIARFLIGPTAAQAQANRNNMPKSGARTKAKPTGTARVAKNNTAPTNSPDAAATADLPRAKPNVVAIVDGESISRDHLGRECLRRYGKDVIEGVVNKQLIAYECQKRGVKITDKDIDEEVSRMASKFGLARDQYLKMLEQERNIKVDQYKNEIIWPMLALKQLAADQIQVTDQDLREAFESEYGPKVKARIIVASTKKKAEQLQAQAKADPDKFAELAKSQSEDVNSASARGLVPPIRKHAGDEKIEKIAFGLKEGEVSEVIPVGEKFVILKCEQQCAESFVPAQDMPTIEGRLRESIADHKLRAASSELFRRLQKETKVVNVMNDEQLSRKMPGVAATVNGRPISLDIVAEECIQRYGEDVLEGEIDRAILQNALKTKRLQITKEDLDAEILRAADAYGFLKSDGTPDVDRWLDHVIEEGGENVTVDLYVRDAVWPSVALKKLVSDTIEISEEEMQMGFEANYGERVEVLAIVCPNERKAQEVWGRARENDTDDFFGQLATQYSIEPVSRANAGRVPPIRRHGGSDALEKAAFELQPGEMSGFINVGDKYIILRCLGRTTPLVKSIDEVHDELEKHLRETKLRATMSTEFERLRSQAKVQVFLTDAITPNGAKNKKP